MRAAKLEEHFKKVHFEQRAEAIGPLQTFEGSIFEDERKYDYKNSKRSVPFASFTGEEKGYIVEQSDIPDGHYSHSDKKLKHFENIEVSLNHSTVYVPPNVNDQEDKILNSIKWSEKLDALFMSNHDADPTLTWQYFASSTGFIRQYPGTFSKTRYNIINLVPGTTWHDDDKKAFDSRMRSWYLEAAASTKDVVILLDSSSMAGANKGHIKNILSTLLDTLTINDFFSAIVLFKMHIETIEFEDIIGDVRVGLKKALKTLSKSRENGFSSGCNQAIISVTDRSYSSYKTMFETYVWPNNNTVNTFTYSFRRDGSNGRKGSWKSCGKFGYFSYISKTSDIKEQVLNYINVIANPQFSQPHKPVVWTNVYADLIDPNKKFTTMKKEKGTLIGVAGTDVPINEIKKLLTPYKLGVNGYSFAITNNGDVLFHPDHRPLYHDLVKPSFNNVDLTEVESVIKDDQYFGPEDIDRNLKKLRKNMIDSKENDLMLRVNVHYDNMQRVASHQKRYYYGPINETPFSLGLVLPIGYGHNKIVGKVKVTQASARNYIGYLRGNWSLHPDWVYCQFRNHSEPQNPKNLLLNLLLGDEAIGRTDFWEKMVRVQPTLKYISRSGSRYTKTPDIYCDPELIESLVFDAQQSDTSEKPKGHFDEKRKYDENLHCKTQHNVCILFMACFLFILGIWHLRNVRSLEERVQVLKSLDSEKSSRKVTDEFGVIRTQIQKNIKRKRDTMDDYENNLNPENKRLKRGTSNDETNKLVLKFAEELGCRDFKASNEVVNDWKSKVSTLCEGYAPRDIFNMDETGLFYKSGKKTTVHPKGSDCAGGKHSEDRLIFVAFTYFGCVMNNSEHIRMTFGITSSFVGTRSGFTRYEMYEDHNDSDWHSNPRMDRIPRRTIDELYYKQAVDFHFYNASAFVYTIPTDAARRDRNEIRVTGSYAIFPEVNGLTSPWGVVGVNMKHAMLASRFFNITSEQRPKCPMNCSSDDYLCYLLDNNGYVVVSSNHADTGKLFEEIDVNLMKALLEFEIYKNWLFEMSTYGWFTETFSLDNNFDPLDVPESTRPRRCYKEIKLYHYKEVPSYRPVTGRMSQCHSSKCGRSFVVTSVPKSNLLLLVVNVECPCVPYTIRHEQKEVQNDAIKANCPEKKRKLYRRPLKEKCVQSYPHVCI
ncbi:Voltage-dependent calcium channel subunit alpha-2/delta-3 [Nymphon striatum]|nr:Voltage-dependent calcium channel subunit alpha-2/delta-3 [Nymphon striatum]